jgi:hypothetical protein
MGLQGYARATMPMATVLVCCLLACVRVVQATQIEVEVRRASMHLHIVCVCVAACVGVVTSAADRFLIRRLCFVAPCSIHSIPSPSIRTPDYHVSATHDAACNACMETKMDGGTRRQKDEPCPLVRCSSLVCSRARMLMPDYRVVQWFVV